MEELYDILIRIGALLVLYIGGHLCIKLEAFLKTKLSAAQADKLDKFITELTNAAEQMYKKEDPDGSIRLEYVERMLVEAGYDVTEAIRAKVESKVFAINNAPKKEG